MSECFARLKVNPDHFDFHAFLVLDMFLLSLWSNPTEDILAKSRELITKTNYTSPVLIRLDEMKGLTIDDQLEEFV
jgi:hypothetical protein